MRRRKEIFKESVRGRRRRSRKRRRRRQRCKV